MGTVVVDRLWRKLLRRQGLSTCSARLLVGIGRHGWYAHLQAEVNEFDKTKLKEIPYQQITFPPQHFASQSKVGMQLSLVLI